MNGATSFWLGVIAFGLLGAVSLYSCVPHIESDLGARAGEALSGADWVEVDVNGQELILSGQAPDQPARAGVLGRVDGLWGVTAVHDRMTVAVPATEDPAAADVAPEPPEMLPPEQDLLPEVEEVATVAVTEQPIDTEAETETEADPEPEAEPVAPDPDERVLACQDELDQLLANERIRFSFGSAELATASYPLLNEIARVASGCAVRIEISGHTDTSGHPSHNRTLSRRRAQSVVRYLVDAGIRADQLTAIGLGSSEPIASNDTRSGRRANRRIEFKAKAAESENDAT